MSDNDIVVLDSVLNQNLKELGGSLSESEYFQLFATEQVLKDRELSYQELTSGIVDGGDDGGIDGFFTFVNGELLAEDTDLEGVKKSPIVEVVLIQSKDQSSFKQTAVEKVTTTVGNLLKFSNDLSDFKDLYNERLLEKADQFRRAYLDLANRHATLRILFVYVSKGRTNTIHAKLNIDVIIFERTVTDLFGGASASVLFLGARQLLDTSRVEKTYTMQLQIVENVLSRGADNYIVLSNLKDFFRFITDESGDLRRYIFEANVRDYQGNVEVNKEIQGTLIHQESIDFWWLNNGITLLASKASVAGKIITLDDVRVVNGLQTTTEVFNYLRDKNLDATEENRAILIKIIVSQKSVVQDRIIKATNFQTSVSPASLRATDRIQKDIEDFFLEHGIHYDRRKNYYKNLGKPVDSIVAIQYLAQAFMAIMLKRPDDARARPTSLIKKDADYEQIFNENIAPAVYLTCVKILLNAEKWLKRSGWSGVASNMRFHFSLVLVVVLSNTLDFTESEVQAIDVDEINQAVYQDVFDLIFHTMKAFNEERKWALDRIVKNKEFVDYLIQKVSVKLADTQHSDVSESSL